MKSYERKSRGTVRRRNHIAHDLEKPQFRQRVKEGKKPRDEDDSWKDDIKDYYDKKG